MDKDLLLAPRLPEADLEVPGVGTIRVRGLSRLEVMGAQQLKGPALDRRLLSLALVDPVLTEAEVGQWQRASVAGEIEQVSAAVSKLSGMAPESAKDAYKSDGSESGAGVRDVPGAEAGDDGGEAPGGAE